MDETKTKLRSGVRYRCVVTADGQYVGSAVVRRIGAHHYEVDATVVGAASAGTAAEVARKAAGAFEFHEVKPRLGELIQQRIKELNDEEKQRSDTE